MRSASFAKGEEIILSQMIYRGGKLLGSQHYDFTNNAQEDAELLESFLIQQYENRPDNPHEILLPLKIASAEAMAEILSTGQPHKVQILVPQRGEKLGRVEMACANAKAMFEQKKDQKVIREKTLLEMQERLRLHHFPYRIECFDNSHIQGAEPVASMVAFTNGAKDSQRYRKYKLKEAAAADDYGAMNEVLMRRYRRAKEENDLPDLVIVDGGKGQLNVARKVFDELELVGVDLIGLAKEEGRHDKGATSEQVYLPNQKDPILLRSTSPILFLLQQIRDEAHRVALTFSPQKAQQGDDPQRAGSDRWHWGPPAARA